MQDDHNEPEDPMLPWIETMREKMDPAEATLRKLGLYVMDVGLAPNPHTPEAPPVMVVNVTIGDVAFSDRVQNPVENRIDAEFKMIENQATKDKFEEMREKMQKALEAGEDPLNAGGDSELE